MVIEHTSYGPCFICKRECDETSVNVDFAGTIATICGICWEKGDEGVSLPLDMTEDSDA